MHVPTFSPNYLCDVFQWRCFVMTFLILSRFEIPLLIPSPHAVLIYEHLLTQRGDSYLNKFVYAERLQMMLEVFVQKVYNLGKLLPIIVVKLEFVSNERINSRAVTEVNIFKKHFWNNGRSKQLVISLWCCWLCCVLWRTCCVMSSLAWY